VSYYAWQLKYGDAEKLVQQFTTEKFTEDSSLSEISLGGLKEEDIGKYMRSFNPVLYPGDKPITIVAFIDFECPFCQGSHSIFKSIVSKYEPMVKVVFKNLSLVIIDEQHRFGVNQRAFLQQRTSALDDGNKKNIPHLLTMTATPIPRTLSLAIFGNLDLSIIDEMPKGRKKSLLK